MADVLVHPGRLKIMLSLARRGTLPFVELRRETALTDGNLATHARRLRSAGLIDVEKSVDSGRPLTTFTLTAAGREALRGHVDRIVDALTEPAAAAARGAPALRTDDASGGFASDDDWID